MDIRHVGDHECISCGDCVDVCPTGAISWKGSKPFLAPSVPSISLDTDLDSACWNFQEQTKKITKRNKAIKIVVATFMSLLLVGALVYFNVIDKPAPVAVGNQVGDECPAEELPLFDEHGLTGETFNPANNDGKITIINFWGTWCGGCVKELPYFDRIASEFHQSVTVVAVHTELDFDTAPAYVEEHYKDSQMLFAKDSLIDPNDRYGLDRYYAALGGVDQYPITLVLDEHGVIIATLMRETTYEELKSIIEAKLQN